MKGIMTIAYELGNSLYVNLTNRCTNRCDFCIRNNMDGVGSGADLWLDREPTADEIFRDILSFDLDEYQEIVFCGYGEPLIRLDEIIAVARELKEVRPDMPIRINTNGQANMIHHFDVTPELAGLIDTVSISLNAKNAVEYEKICHSDFGEAAFDGLLDFAKRAKAHIPHVVLTVVDVLPEADIEACREIAKNVGVEFRVRKYQD